MEFISILGGYFSSIILCFAFGWLSYWFFRKFTAKLQSRVGPPWYQPIADVIKLMGKEFFVPGLANRLIYIVAPFVGLLGNPTFDTINKTFTDREFNWEKIRSNCKRFYVYSSDNDPYVPIDKGKFLAEKLNAMFRIIHGARHFNGSAGYTKFELLLKDMKDIEKML